jgi:isopropylmalate/homocitrate/citramalate synthase
MANSIRNLRERVPNSDKAVWSVHCHNDLAWRLPIRWRA